MTWTAKLQDTTSCQAAVAHFDFPKKTLTKDFSTTFTLPNQGTSTASTEINFVIP